MGHMPYSKYGSFDATGVPQLPSHWTSKRARFVCSVNPSKSEINLPTDALVSFVPMDAVGEYGGLLLTNEKPIDEIGSGYTYFSNGDVVIAKITPCFENGKGALATNLTNGIAFGTTELHVVRATSEIEPSFLFYISISDHFRKVGISEMYGAGGQKRIPDSFIKDFRLGLPPRNEQILIVKYLNHETARIDEIIAKKRQLLLMLEEKRLAIITFAMTKGLDASVQLRDSGISWLGKFPAHWQVLPLIRVVRKFVDYRGATPTKIDAGVPLITASQIKNGQIDHSLDPVFISEEEYADRMTRGLPEKGDVLVTTEAPLGETAQIDDEFVAPGQRIILLKPDLAKVTKDYLFAHFRSDVGRSELLSRASGSTASGIRADRLKASMVLVPPIPEQILITAHIAEAIRHLAPISQTIERQIERLREYRSALITNAVTGKIDVRSFEPKEAAA